MSLHFTLYYRENCHLCQSMRLALVTLQQELDFSWQEVDIDRDPELIHRFDMLVPVLQHEGREVCHYFIDEEALRKLLGESVDQ